MARARHVDAKNAWDRAAYAATLAAIIKGGFCPFCEEHLAKHHRKPILIKGRHWIVTENAWPYEGAKKHFLFIARTHIERAEDLSDSAWKELRTLYSELVARHKLAGATLFMRSGDTKMTGASVNHLHAQLLAGRQRGKTTEPIRAVIGFKKK